MTQKILASGSNGDLKRSFWSLVPQGGKFFNPGFEGHANSEKKGYRTQIVV